MTPLWWEETRDRPGDTQGRGRWHRWGWEGTRVALGHGQVTSLGLRWDKGEVRGHPEQGDMGRWHLCGGGHQGQVRTGMGTPGTGEDKDGDTRDK